jgi:hypothetical protein
MIHGVEETWTRARTQDPKMPTYRGNRGNRGNPLQHWVLVELLGDLRDRGIQKLCYVDAHSMSPTPTRSAKADTDQTAPDFAQVRSRLADFAAMYVRADNSMMSFIFSRQVTMASDLENRFQSWLASRTKRAPQL